MMRVADFAASLERHKVLVRPWVQESDWQRLRDLADDRHLLPATHAEFEHADAVAIAELERRGFIVDLITIDPDDWAQWCRTFGEQLDAKARDHYALLRRIELQCKLTGGVGHA